LALAPAWVRAAEPDPRAARIVSGMIAIDMHSHVQVPFARTPADIRPDPDIDLLGQMRRAGFSAVCQTYNTDQAGETAEDAPRFQDQALAFEGRLLKRNGMARALTLADIEAAHARGRPIIVQSIEGAQFIQGRLERLEDSHRRGLRHLQLVHDRDDSVEPLGDTYTGSSRVRGLTPFGAEVIRACNRLGVVVDLSHGTRDMVFAAVKVTDRPPIISHTGMISDAGKRPLTDDLRRRVITDEQARAVADLGGVVGVWWRLFDTVKDYVAAIRVRAEAIGVDHVGIGTDSDLTASYVLPYTNQIWPDEAGGFVHAVVGEMLKQGFAAEEIAKICGGNFCRVFGQVTAARG
jgi:membrane dipeptidase